MSTLRVAYTTLAALAILVAAIPAASADVSVTAFTMTGPTDGPASPLPTHILNKFQVIQDTIIVCGDATAGCDFTVTFTDIGVTYTITNFYGVIVNHHDATTGWTVSITGTGNVA